MKARIHTGLAASAAGILLIGAAALSAEHGRNFAGSFEIRDVVNDGAVVKFELRARIFNYSGADLHGATIALSGRDVRRVRDAAEYQGAIGDVSIPYRKSVEIDGTFSVAAHEFEQWQRGAAPNLVMSYVNGEGKEVHDHIELRPEIGAPKGVTR